MVHRLTKFLGIILLILVGGCASTKKKEENLVLHTAYKEGLVMLKKKNYEKAAQRFGSLSTQFVQSPWSVKAKALEAYSWYRKGDMTKAKGAAWYLSHGYPHHPLAAYGAYMNALSDFHSIQGIMYDMRVLAEVQSAFSFVVHRYPSSSYARYAADYLKKLQEWKAAHDLYVGMQHYQSRKYVAAYKRFYRCWKQGRYTPYAPEALWRMGEILRIFGYKKDGMNIHTYCVKTFPSHPISKTCLISQTLHKKPKQHQKKA